MLRGRLTEKKTVASNEPRPVDSRWGGSLRYVAALGSLALLVVAGCGGKVQNAGTPAPSAAQTPGEVVASSAPASPGAQASPAPEASSVRPPRRCRPRRPDTNLLSWANGTIVRAYPVAALGATPDLNRFVEHGPNYASGASGPFTFVFELPTTATITGFAADLDAAGTGTPPSSVAFAVSTAGPNAGFSDVGTLTANAQAGTKTLAAAVKARWVKVTAGGPAFESIAATGTLAPLPAGVSPAGTYVELDDSPAKNGAFNEVPSDSSPWYRRVAMFGDGMTAERCYDGRTGDAYPGEFDGRTWTFAHGTRAGRAVVNDDASLIVGGEEGSAFYLERTSQRPKFCQPFVSGGGPHRVLVLDGNGQPGRWPVGTNDIPGFTYERIGAGMLEPGFLDGREMVVLNALCDTSDNFLSKPQTDGLLQWVTAGRKLMIYDSDECSKSAYPFLPYQFTTANPGARGASGKRLILVESDALGSADKSDAAHYFDPKSWVSINNQLGDANTVTSNDSHWCGHLFGTNALDVNGFMQMYAPYGKGTIVYNGFDDDDANLAPYRRVRSLEYALPVPNDLPCTQRVAGGFIIQPDQEAGFTAGKPQTLTFAMELLANQGWKGHVTVSTTGDFQAAVTPESFDVSGGTQPLQVTLTIPGAAKAGAYTVNVIGDGAGGLTAQAAITLTATAPLKKAVIAKHQRIRIYGIHFDYDSAHIQSRSEPVVADIAALMRANPAWHFEVSGHTDSDGGAVYNLGLSQRRAQAVVNDLVARYRIARSRLIAKGYGLSRPVASNATAAGKALNRRVELERLQ